MTPARYLRRVYVQRRLLLATAFLAFIHFYYTKKDRVAVLFFLEGENFHHFNIFVLGRPHSHLFVAPNTPVSHEVFYGLRRLRK